MFVNPGLQPRRDFRRQNVEQKRLGALRFDVEQPLKLKCLSVDDIEQVGEPDRESRTAAEPRQRVHQLECGAAAERHREKGGDKAGQHDHGGLERAVRQHWDENHSQSQAADTGNEAARQLRKYQGKQNRIHAVGIEDRKRPILWIGANGRYVRQCNCNQEIENGGQADRSGFAERERIQQQIPRLKGDECGDAEAESKPAERDEPIKQLLRISAFDLRLEPYRTPVLQCRLLPDSTEFPGCLDTTACCGFCSMPSFRRSRRMDGRCGRPSLQGGCSGGFQPACASRWRRRCWRCNTIVATTIPTVTMATIMEASTLISGLTPRRTLE